MRIGFSHVGLATHDMDATIRFYRDVLGFPKVKEERLSFAEGGTVRHVFFDCGHGQMLAFIEAKAVPGTRDDFDTGINRGLGVPSGMYHVAFAAETLEQLDDLKRHLVQHGIDVSIVIDHETGRSIYFQDPNEVQLEYCCVLAPQETVLPYTERHVSLRDYGALSA
jgi:catechol 2,3-dioxygenase-like lactoylglutathione lyase family enzyme